MSSFSYLASICEFQISRWDLCAVGPKGINLQASQEPQTNNMCLVGVRTKVCNLYACVPAGLCQPSICVEGVLPGVCQPVGCLCTPLCSVCVCVCVSPRRSGVRWLYVSCIQVWSTNSCTFTLISCRSRWKFILYARLETPGAPAPPALTHAHTSRPQLTNDSRVNGSKVQTVFLSGHWWLQWTAADAVSGLWISVKQGYSERFLPEF